MMSGLFEGRLRWYRGPPLQSRFGLSLPRLWSVGTHFLLWGLEGEGLMGFPLFLTRVGVLLGAWWVRAFERSSLGLYGGVMLM